MKKLSSGYSVRTFPNISYSSLTDQRSLVGITNNKYQLVEGYRACQLSLVGLNLAPNIKPNKFVFENNLEKVNIQPRDFFCAKLKNPDLNSGKPS